MKVRSGVIGVVTVFFVLASVAFAAQSPAHPQASRYVIRSLGFVPGYSGVSVAGLNDRGQVVGSVFRGSASRAFLSVNGRMTLLPLPAGFSASSALGIDDRGTILVAATNGSRGTPFAVEDGGLTWRRLVVSGWHGRIDIGGIAADGDIAGTVSRSQRLPDYSWTQISRAVIWRPLAGGSYPPAGELGLSHGMTQSSASAIWSGKLGDIIGGEQRNGALRSFVSLWSPREVWIPDVEGYPEPMLTAIGGWGQALYAVGRFPGVDTSTGWSARILIPPDGAASLTGPLDLPFPTFERGAECFYGASQVSAGARGRMLAVGRVDCFISARKGPAALIWRGSHVQNLQTSIPRGTGWKLASADALNRRGEIAGVGSFHGHERAYLLSGAG